MVTNVNSPFAMKARRTFHHLSGVVKFEALIQDHMARDQTVTALNYIHSWSRIQDEIRARRLCMITEARIKQKRLENQLKVEAKIHELEVLSLSFSCDGFITTVVKQSTIGTALSNLFQHEERCFFC